MFKNIWTNFKTTIAGAIAGVPQIIHGISTKNYGELIGGIATLILGLSAADHSNSKP